MCIHMCIHISHYSLQHIVNLRYVNIELGCETCVMLCCETCFELAMKRYAVVIFDSSSSSAVVPCTWLFVEDGKTFCYYPPSTWTNNQLNRAVTTCSDPDTSWEEYGCRHKYSTGFYIILFMFCFIQERSYETCILSKFSLNSNKQ